MTNTQIIINGLRATGYTDSQITEIQNAFGGLPFHTFQTWKRLGYSVKKGEHALFTCYLWRYTKNPSAKARKAAEEAGEEVAEDPHYYKAKAHIFSYAQVEKKSKGICNATAAPVTLTAM